MTSSKPRSNRNPVKQWFFTFPHSSTDDLKVSKHQFRDFLIQFKPNFYHIVRETHEDGSPHLHACVRFTGGYSFANIMKKLKLQYPNSYKRIDIKPVRSMKHAIGYLSKEDKNPLTTGTFESKRNPAKAVRANLYRRLALITNLSWDTYEEFLHNQQLVEKARADNLPKIIEHIANYPMDLNREQSKLLEKFLEPNFPLSKDDMTFITKYFNIRFN